jgi:hypothetical protein
MTAAAQMQPSDELTTAILSLKRAQRDLAACRARQDRAEVLRMIESDGADHDDA